MIELFHAAKEIAEFFETNRWEYVFIGGLAVLRWGEIRTTADVDATLLTRYQNEKKYIADILSRFAPRINDAEGFAMQNRVLLLKADNGISIDLSLAGLPFEEKMIERSSVYRFTEEYPIRTCSAEDLVVLKAFADRTKDWWDIESIFVRQKGELDITYIFNELIPLCEMKDDPQIVERLKVLASFDQSSA